MTTVMSMPAQTRKTLRTRLGGNDKYVEPLLEYRDLLNEIDFSERGTSEELAARDLSFLKATKKIRKRANTVVLGRGK